MNWFAAVIRIAGASFPGAASLVQFQAEFDANELRDRINRLEDPISHLHPDIPGLSKHLYSEITSCNTKKLRFDGAFYESYTRPLALLEANEFIEGSHGIGKPYAAGLWVRDPTYIMYMCALSENEAKMRSLFERVDSCKRGEWLHAHSLGTDLPLPVIDAVFEIYERRGLGLRSKEVGGHSYLGKA